MPPAASGDQQSIGAVLRAAQEARGLSAADVAALTCIRMTLIRDIEEDRYGACGGAVYARGHIRAIATAVGVDPAPLIARYDAAFGTAVEEPLPIADFTPTIPRESRRTPNWAAGMVLALAAVVVIAAVAYFTGSSGPPSDNQLAGPTPAGVVTSAGPAPSHRPSPTSSDPTTVPSGVIAEVAPSGVHVVVRITDERSWLHVSNAAGSDLFTGVLAPGTTKEFTDTTAVKMTIGYPPAVDLVVNGHDIGVTGGASEVTRVTFGPNDPVGSGA